MTAVCVRKRVCVRIGVGVTGVCARIGACVRACEDRSVGRQCDCKAIAKTGQTM